jgi:hypothetical protein
MTPVAGPDALRMLQSAGGATSATGAVEGSGRPLAAASLPGFSSTNGVGVRRFVQPPPLPLSPSPASVFDGAPESPSSPLFNDEPAPPRPLDGRALELCLRELPLLASGAVTASKHLAAVMERGSLAQQQRVLR